LLIGNAVPPRLAAPFSRLAVVSVPSWLSFDTASGTFDTVTVGSGSNTITATGTFATLNLGDGTDTTTLKNTFATVNVGHGTYNLEFTSGFGSKLAFGSDVASDHLWFEHVGQDLRIDVIGSSEQKALQPVLAANWR
jgi:hypothetical protein